MHCLLLTTKQDSFVSISGPLRFRLLLSVPELLLPPDACFAYAERDGWGLHGRSHQFCRIAMCSRAHFWKRFSLVNCFFCHCQSPFFHMSRYPTGAVFLVAEFSTGQQLLPLVLWLILRKSWNLFLSVVISHLFSNPFILLISFSLHLFWHNMTWVISSAWLTSTQPLLGPSKSALWHVKRAGLNINPCGTPLRRGNFDRCRVPKLLVVCLCLFWNWLSKEIALFNVTRNAIISNLKKDPGSSNQDIGR